MTAIADSPDAVAIVGLEMGMGQLYCDRRQAGDLREISLRPAHVKNSVEFLSGSTEFLLCKDPGTLVRIGLGAIAWLIRVLALSF